MSAPKVAYDRVQHAAHYYPPHPDVGHDLERWDAVQAWTDPRPEGVPADAERHSGYIDKQGHQHVIFTRRAPLTGDCSLCRAARRGSDT